MAIVFLAIAALSQDHADNRLTVAITNRSFSPGRREVGLPKKARINPMLPNPDPSAMNRARRASYPPSGDNTT